MVGNADGTLRVVGIGVIEVEQNKAIGAVVIVVGDGIAAVRQVHHIRQHLGAGCVGVGDKLRLHGLSQIRRRGGHDQLRLRAPRRSHPRETRIRRLVGRRHQGPIAAATNRCRTGDKSEYRAALNPSAHSRD